MKKIQVEDHPDLMRDSHSKAIINKDSSAYQKRKMERMKVCREADQRDLMMKLKADNMKHENKIKELDSKLDIIIGLLSKRD